jgi:thioredoxin 1
MAQFTSEISDADFQKSVLESDIPVLVDFWAPWCGPCLAVAPTLDALAGEYQGKVKIAKMNVDENANTPASFGVRSIPFMVMFKGGKVVDSLVGAHPKARLKELIDKALS